MRYIYSLRELPSGVDLHFGGKAESLSRLLLRRMPVPPGYVIAAEGFSREKQGLELRPDAAKELARLLPRLSTRHTYAVRSSAVGEDGKYASFAGAYETVLNVLPQDIPEAVSRVAASSNSERVRQYAAHRGRDVGPMAVIIQRMVPAEFAGVLFTADPVTGSAARMTGNVVQGLGERLVSGDADPYIFTYELFAKRYSGDPRYRKAARKLVRLAARLAREEGLPLDIEWAVAGGRVHLLQSRPISTLSPGDENVYDINESLAGEYLFSKTNVGEIFMHPVPPMTHSILRTMFIELGIPLISNIHGRLYMNVSAVCSLLVSFGIPREKAFAQVKDLVGALPAGTEVPIYPFDNRPLFRKLLTMFLPAPRSKFVRLTGRDFPDRINEIGEELIAIVRRTDKPEELYKLWFDACNPYMQRVLKAIVSGLQIKPLFGTREKLEAICGPILTDELCSNTASGGALESLRPILAIGEILDGRMTRDEYRRLYGHRHADEMDVSCPYPYENPNFPDDLIQAYQTSNLPAARQKNAQEQRHHDAVQRFKTAHPKESRRIYRILRDFNRAVTKREKLRSDSVRLFCLIREYLLKIAALSGVGEDIFYYTFREALELLRGIRPDPGIIAARRENHEKNLAMPEFPNLIVGRFEPEIWLREKNRRMDITVFGRNMDDSWDTSSDSSPTTASEVASGSASGTVPGSASCTTLGIEVNGLIGCAGKAEGRVRILQDLRDADDLLSGEILVVVAANIGWISIFPRAAAIITDIGAPLSHAIIVARELGIPAVVGCGNATTVLKTGDHVVVDANSGRIRRVWKDG